jgi:hypothetical protein
MQLACINKPWYVYHPPMTLLLLAFQHCSLRVHDQGSDRDATVQERSTPSTPDLSDHRLWSLPRQLTSTTRPRVHPTFAPPTQNQSSVTYRLTTFTVPSLPSLETMTVFHLQTRRQGEKRKSTTEEFSRLDSPYVNTTTISSRQRSTVMTQRSLDQPLLSIRHIIPSLTLRRTLSQTRCYRVPRRSWRPNMSPGASKHSQFSTMQQRNHLSRQEMAILHRFLLGLPPLIRHLRVQEHLLHHGHGGDVAPFQNHIKDSFRGLWTSVRWHHMYRYQGSAWQEQCVHPFMWAFVQEFLSEVHRP